ncbi:putative TrmH family tRNA/rRNA methyltransferase [Oxobacter pfennigii]|uniref:Putative TrmH family tRNA/rRNA methyltransferase n=1 Tax=Oxobacter pfennigii TaxID=36849 RepID=A0A0P8W3Y7_9CLOT|nr:23S rRNA (guanosine(2251)-2'-O)-methyltransferase RlmB [Oxobacter pfennigii]KPU42121.1 putative TrmH family tRNA/rRNA methyltransferase [Oxobacter pfennigii]
MEIIKSKDNQILKYIRKLKNKKTRLENGEFLIEGIRFIEEALISNADIKYCICSHELKGDRAEILIKNLKDKGITVYAAEDKLMKDICDTETPQGIAAVVKQKHYDEDLLFLNSNYTIVADRIQDPGNMGTIIRTADAAGADLIVLSNGSVDPYSPKVLRSTMGSIFHIPIILSNDINGAAERMKKSGFLIYATSLDAKSFYYDENYRGKTAVIIGNEANGVEAVLLNKADKLIKIPMPGRAESLNASVSAGIVMFEIARQRMDIDKNG